MHGFSSQILHKIESITKSTASKKNHKKTISKPIPTKRNSNNRMTQNPQINQKNNRKYK
jgi:hypothetical protein